MSQCDKSDRLTNYVAMNSLRAHLGIFPDTPVERYFDVACRRVLDAEQYRRLGSARRIAYVGTAYVLLVHFLELIEAYADTRVPEEVAAIHRSIIYPNVHSVAVWFSENYKGQPLSELEGQLLHEADRLWRLMVELKQDSYSRV